MNSKFAEICLYLLFAVLCSAVSGWATWTLGTMIADATGAQAWTVVPATVEQVRRGEERRSVRAIARYRYRVDGRDHTSTRLGIARANIADNVGDWQERMFSNLQAAHDGNQTINVFVNPRDPSESVVDRDLRWPLMVFLLPFILVFGGVAVAMLFAIRDRWRPASASKSGALPVTTRGPIPAGDNASGMLTFIALLWCGFTFPIAALYMPTMIAAREWFGLLVPLAFIGVGVGLLALTVMSMLGRLLHGRAVLDLDHIARVGEPFVGTISFAKGVAEGDRFRVKLACEWVRQVDSRSSKSSGTVAKRDTLWSAEVDRAATADGKLRFVFAPPPELPGSAGADTDKSKIRWSIWLTQQNGLRASRSFAVIVDGPPPDAVAMARLLSAAGDPPKTTINPWVVYGLSGVAIAVFVGAMLFTLYQYASAFIQFAAKFFG